MMNSALAPNVINVFVCFDVEHDGELCERLLAESRTPLSGFAVLGGSGSLTTADLESEGVRRLIREADQLIVICGEHTGDSPGVTHELRIAQQEQTPYFLLWGRRESMCTKPIGAKPADAMYSWTQRILWDQLAITRRASRSGPGASIVRRAASKGGSGAP